MKKILNLSLGSFGNSRTLSSSNLSWSCFFISSISISTRSRNSLSASLSINSFSVRSIFNKYGGNLGTNGSLGFLFERKGIFTVNKGSIDYIDLEEVEMELIDFGFVEFS